MGGVSCFAPFAARRAPRRTLSKMVFLGGSQLGMALYSGLPNAFASLKRIHGHVFCVLLLGTCLGYRNPKSSPQEPTGSLRKTTISHVQAHRNPISVPQEPTASLRKTTISHLRAYRNPNSVPQEPSVLHDSCINSITFRSHPVRLL